MADDDRFGIEKKSFSMPKNSPTKQNTSDKSLKERESGNFKISFSYEGNPNGIVKILIPIFVFIICLGLKESERAGALGEFMTHHFILVCVTLIPTSFAAIIAFVYSNRR